MANNLRVSRGSLRQVLKMLEIMGVVSQRVGDGTYLNAAAPSILAEPMEFLILLDGISFEELMEARLIVEPELAARAATRASPEQLAALRAATDRMGSQGEVVEDDLQFHRTIFPMADNRVCSLMFSIVHQSLHKLMEMTSQMVDLEHTLRCTSASTMRSKSVTPTRRAPRRCRGRTRRNRELLTKSNAARMQSQLGDRLSTLSLARTPSSVPPAGAPPNRRNTPHRTRAINRL